MLTLTHYTAGILLAHFFISDVSSIIRPVSCKYLKGISHSELTQIDQGITWLMCSSSRLLPVGGLRSGPLSEQPLMSGCRITQKHFFLAHLLPWQPVRWSCDLGGGVVWAEELMNCSHRVLCQGGLSPWQDYWRTGGSWRDIYREKWVDAKREREIWEMDWWGDQWSEGRSLWLAPSFTSVPSEQQPQVISVTSVFPAVEDFFPLHFFSSQCFVFFSWWLHFFTGKSKINKEASRVVFSLRLQLNDDKFDL